MPGGEIKKFDDIVVGAGNAYALGRALAVSGRKVALIEPSELGGTCPNRGCIPSKLLLAHADAAEAVRDAHRFHVSAELNGIDVPAVLQDVIDAQSGVDSKLEEILPETATLFRARGKFVGPRTIEAGGVTIEGERVIIATGARPSVPPISGLSDTPFWTSREVFSVTEPPASLIVLGGGYIGCEMAYFFAAMGVDVTVVQRGPNLVPAVDGEVRAVFQAGFTERVRTLLQSSAVAVRHDGSEFEVDVERPDGSRESLRGAQVLVATGRVPNTNDLGLDSAGVETNERGFITVDDHLRTSADGVYALGDVSGAPMFTHVASGHARYLESVFLNGHDGAVDLGEVPWSIFTRPEVAGIGKTQQQLEKDGTEFVAASVPYSTAAKGRAIKERHGMAKLILAPGGEIFGFHAVGEHASVLLHEVIPVMRWRNHVSSLTDMMHVHPSLPEITRNVARKAEGMLAG